MVLSAVLISGVALADYATGYALRLSMLHLIPIAIAAWTAGARRGYGAAVIAASLWLFSFHADHFYQHHAHYVWEGTAMLGGFMAFAWLSARLSQALRQADERFLSVLKEMRAAVYVFDVRQRRVLYANPESQRILGDLWKTGEAEFARRLQRDADGAVGLPVDPSTDELVAGTYKDKDTGRWYLLQSGPIPWGGNAQVRLKVLTDITAQKSAERLREKNREVMHEAAQLSVLAETASTLAHEINQPLMVIATYTDACQRLLAATQPDLTEIARVLQKCHAQSVRASSIIEHLREFVRQRRPHVVRCEVQGLLAEAIDLLRPVLEEARVHLDLKPENALLEIEVDRVLVVQVLINLIRNAVDSVMPLEDSRRRIVLQSRLEGADEIVFSVIDQGVGLDQDAMESAFSPFVTSKSDGLGLGLAISRSIVEAHGGRMWVEHNPGGGAIFSLLLPVCATGVVQ